MAKCKGLTGSAVKGLNYSHVQALRFTQRELQKIKHFALSFKMGCSRANESNPARSVSRLQSRVACVCNGHGAHAQVHQTEITSSVSGRTCAIKLDRSLLTSSASGRHFSQFAVDFVCPSCVERRPLSRDADFHQIFDEFSVVFRQSDVTHRQGPSFLYKLWTLFKACARGRIIARMREIVRGFCC